MANDIKYNELGKAKIQESRNIIISSASKGGFTIAQQLEVNEGNRKTNVFLKNAIIVDDLSGLYNIRDAINLAIQKCESEQSTNTEVSDNTDWDE